MASEITLFTNDRSWKAEVEAWKNNFLFYKSIGTKVAVFHREQAENIWGNTVSTWVRRAASSIEIGNVYRAATGLATATRNKTCQNASYCELKEWAVGVNITIPVDEPTDVGGGATLDIDRVDGSVRIVIGHEVLSGTVSASSALGDSSLW